jgi:hypothetical protein
MTRPAIYVVSFLLLILTVPWFFTEPSETIVLGFPVWAFYSLTASLVYATCMCFILGRYWNLLAGEDDEAEGEEE